VRRGVLVVVDADGDKWPCRCCLLLLLLMLNTDAARGATRLQSGPFCFCTARCHLKARLAILTLNPAPSAMRNAHFYTRNYAALSTTLFSLCCMVYH